MSLNQSPFISLVKYPILTEKTIQLLQSNQYSFAVDKKANKVVAREMIKMTQNANSVMANLNFKEVSCWTCHRGNKIPERSPFKMS